MSTLGVDMKEVYSEDIGGSAVALALNKSTTNQVAVVGRSIYKIFNITEKGFEFVANLRVVKSSIASCNDVAWNQVDENILATSTPSGAVVTWNLNKAGYSKIDMVYQDHKRIVNKINFHCSDANLLVSGSQDSIKVFDLRQNEAAINYAGLNEPVRDVQFSPNKPNVFIAVQDNGYVQLYDIRKKDKFEQSFPAHNGPILACDWHPEQPDTFATAGRDMNIKVWCVSGQTPQMQHCIQTMESVSKVRWSYDDTSHVASCSLKRDYSINVWDIHRPYIAWARFSEPHDITTGMAWRSSAGSLISVTASGCLYQLYVSDAYRPLEHAKPVGMAINPDGDIALALGNGLFRSSKISSLPNQTTSNANMSLNAGSTLVPSTTPTTAPLSGVVSAGSATAASAATVAASATTAPQQSSLPSKFSFQAPQPASLTSQSSTAAAAAAAASKSNTGATIGSSVGGSGASSAAGSAVSSIGAAGSSANRQSFVARRSHDSSSRPKISSRSQLDVYKCTEMNWFVKTAQEYQLSNRSLAELCDHNAEVCAKLRRFQICQTWKILKLFYANINTSNASKSQSANDSHQNSHQPQGSTSHTTIRQQQQQQPSIVTPGAATGDEMSLDSQAITDSELSYLSRRHQQSTKELANIATRVVPELVSPSNDELLDLEASSPIGSEQSQDSADEWMTHETLSYEAFQPKHDFCGRVDKLMDRKLDDSSSSSTSSHHERDDYMTTPINRAVSLVRSPSATATDHVSDHNDLRIAHHSYEVKAYHQKFFEIIADVIADVLKYHVDNGDVQSAVSILIVLGDRIKNIVNERIPEVDRESWYYSYIDLLSKFQLWNVMAQVINLSPLPNINSINQTSTTIYTACGTCNRPLNGKVGWICDRCKTKPSECSVCHGVVAGLMAWCQGCRHGGHLIHMSQWFSENDYCPTGCGHICEVA